MKEADLDPEKYRADGGYKRWIERFVREKVVPHNPSLAIPEVYTFEDYLSFHTMMCEKMDPDMEMWQMKDIWNARCPEDPWPE